MARRAGSVLEVAITGEVQEGASRNPFVRGEALALHDLTEAVRQAGDDRRIKALVVRLDAPEMGWSKAESLHRAILRFRDSGKPSLALLSRGGNTAYFVAAAAKEVALDPASSLDLHSLASESFFLQDLLGEVGVEPELDAIGEYKSSGEMFSRRESTEANRLQTRELVFDLHQHVVSRIAEARSLSAEAVADLLTRGPFVCQEALERRLVDLLAADEDAEKILEERVGSRIRLLAYRRYLRRGALRRRLWRWRRPRIAVVHVEGVITGGETPRLGLRAVSARALADLLGNLRKRPRVKAIVLRIESPGGGAVASDRIRRAVQATSHEKPVVVSMGDVAASGGYYIATAASAILAEGSTLTGSIGVVGGKFVLRRFLDRLGIHRETYSTGANAEFFSPFHSYTPEERSRHRDLLRHFYENQFLPAVAEGRGLHRDQVDAVARGRVWTGRQAQARGLVDSLGGTEDAIVRACEKAGVPRARARVIVYSPRRRLRELLLRGVNGWSTGPGALGLLGTALALVEELAREELLLLAPRWLRIR
jgi:protease-4